MRKVTKEVIAAFTNRYAKTIANSSTDGTSLYLHGNKIAEYREDGLYITNAGWRSNTTKERLNGLPNVRIYQSKGIWYLNGEAWSGNWIKVN